MNLRRNNSTLALSRTEVLIIVAVAAFFVCLGALWMQRARNQARSVCCNCNLKQVGLTFMVWAADNHENNPMCLSVTNGGTRERLATGEVFSTFQIMSNQLSTPFVLVCPEDRERLPAKSFATSFNNQTVSYF